MNFLITAGGTREYIDPVRFISNASSGRMGFALTRAALQAGHKVTLVTTVARRSSLVSRVTGHERRVTVIEVETAAEMFKAVKKYFPRCDCLLMAAAVADYTPVHLAKTKIRRENKLLTIKLKPTPDILKWAGKRKSVHRRSSLVARVSIYGSRVTGHGSRIIVGFALEDKNLRANAERKLKEKKLDMIVANTPAAIGADKSAVQIKICGRKWLRLAHATKAAIAKRIIREVESLKN